MVQQHFAKVKKLFAAKKIVVFAGETVFNEIEHDIFSEAAQKEVILCPRLHAYRIYNQIIEKALSYSDDYVFCFILGPTATVAAYELAEKGRVAWDVGHVAQDYDAFMKQLPVDYPRMQKFWQPD